MSKSKSVEQKPDSQQIKSKSGVTAQFFTATVALVTELLGIREAKDKEKGYTVNGPDGQKRYVMDKNKSNRPFSLSLAKTYAEQLLRGEWAGGWNSPSSTGNGETFVIDKKGNVVSMAHRGFGLFIAEMERLRLNKIGADAKIEELGCTKEIVIHDCLVVQEVDPAAADTNDTGKARSLGDVLFRRGEFDSKDYTESDLKGLATALSVAVRHVWLRTNGYTVKGGPKLYHSEAVDFLSKHPLLKAATVFVYEENKGDKDNKRPIDRFGFSLGYAAAHLYLAAFRDIKPEGYHDGSRDMTRRPSVPHWDAAEKFWQDFAQVANVGKAGTAPIIWETLKVLGDHKDAKQILDRDGLCTVVTRAMSAFLDDPEQSYTTNKLRAGLVNTKNDPEFVADFARFGGLDQDRTVLDELGYTQDASALGVVSRTSTDKWKVGDTCWVEQAEEGRETIAWFGEIKSLSDAGEKASVFSIEDEAEYDCYVSWLRIDEPEVVEPEVEEVPPTDEAELTPAD